MQLKEPGRGCGHLRPGSALVAARTTKLDTRQIAGNGTHARLRMSAGTLTAPGPVARCDGRMSAPNLPFPAMLVAVDDARTVASARQRLPRRGERGAHGGRGACGRRRRR